jgi:hypothetical protein
VGRCIIVTGQVTPDKVTRTKPLAFAWDTTAYGVWINFSGPYFWPETYSVSGPQKPGPAISCILFGLLISGVKESLEFALSGGRGRSVLRAEGNSRVFLVDGPALFSYAEDNL